MDRYTLALIGELTRTGVEVTVFHREREPIQTHHLRELSCRVLGLQDCCGVHWEQVAVPVALSRGGFDLYHAPAERGVPLWSPCPVVLTIHSVTAASYERLIRRHVLPGHLCDYLGHDIPRPRWHPRTILARAQVRRTDHILTPSEFSRREVIRFLHVRPAKVTVTPLGVPAQFLAPARPAPERDQVLGRLGVRRPYVLYVGGYETHKNVGGLLECLAAVRSERPDLSLVLAGTKTIPERLSMRTAELGLRIPEDVVFLRDVNLELPDLYDGAVAFLSLSWRESFGLPALEALSRGLIPVVSSWGAAPEVLGDVGVLVDPRHPAIAAKRLLELLHDPNRKVRAERGRQRAQRFGWQAAAETTLRVYQQCMARRSARPVVRREAPA